MKRMAGQEIALDDGEAAEIVEAREVVGRDPARGAHGAVRRVTPVVMGDGRASGGRLVTDERGTVEPAELIESGQHGCEARTHGDLPVRAKGSGATFKLGRVVSPVVAAAAKILAAPARRVEGPAVVRSAARALPRGEQREQRHEGGEPENRNRDPADHREPAAAERAPALILTGQADGPDARAALGEHAAVPAHGLAAARARPHREGAAADAAGGRAAAVDGDERAGHAARVPRPARRATKMPCPTACRVCRSVARTLSEERAHAGAVHPAAGGAGIAVYGARARSGRGAVLLLVAGARRDPHADEPERDRRHHPTKTAKPHHEFPLPVRERSSSATRGRPHRVRASVARGSGPRQGRRAVGVAAEVPAAGPG